MPKFKTVEEYKQHENYGKLPERILCGLLNYRDHGIIPGVFLQNAICNNYAQTVARADFQMVNLHAELGMFLWNELPAPAWGSEEKMKAWAKRIREYKQEQEEGHATTNN